MNDLINQEDLMRKLKISRNTLYIWRTKQGLPYYKHNRSIRFDYEEVLNWLNNK